MLKRAALWDGPYCGLRTATCDPRAPPRAHFSYNIFDKNSFVRSSFG